MTCNTSAVAVCCSSASRVSVDQPRVLHRDDRLRREVLQQRDLLVRERADFLAVDVRMPEQRIVLPQRHAKQRANAAEIHQCSRMRIARSVDPRLPQIGDMDNTLAAEHAAPSVPGLGAADPCRTRCQLSRRTPCVAAAATNRNTSPS